MATPKGIVMLKKIQLTAVSLVLLLIAACSSDTQSVPQLTPQQISQLYNPAGNTILGNPNGGVTVVEIFDYQCPYCRKMVPIMQKLVKANPNVRVVFKEILLFGPTSEPSTEAALAAQQQGKYLAMHTALLSAPQPLDNEKIMQIAKNLKLDTKKLMIAMTSSGIKQQIQQNTELADDLNITAAPVFIIANSNIATNPQAKTKQLMLVGEASLDKLQQLIAKVK